jgi:hypothetical protein
MRFWQQACSQSRRANRVRFIENRFAPRFETRERHQKSETNNQSEQSQKRLLQCRNVATRTVNLGPYAQSPSNFARSKDNGDANKKADKKEVVVQVSHGPTSAANKFA